MKEISGRLIKRPQVIPYTSLSERVAIAMADPNNGSEHIGNMPTNEAEFLWAKQAGGQAKVYLFADDKEGTMLYEMDSLSEPPDKYNGTRISWLRYPARPVFYNDEWYCYQTEENVYGSAGCSLLKAKYSPRNLAYSARVLTVTDENYKRWDGKLSYNPIIGAMNPEDYPEGITGPWALAWQKWLDEPDSIGGPATDYSAGRISVGPTPEGPWTDIPGNILSDVLANQDGLDYSGYQGDPKLEFTRDGKCYFFVIWGDGRNVAGFSHGCGYFEVNPLTYKAIPGTLVKFHQGNAISSQFERCSVTVPEGMQSNHLGNELGFHDPGYLEIGNENFIVLPHAGHTIAGQAYDYPCGYHFYTLPPHNMGAATPVEFPADPKADFVLDFTTLDISSLDSTGITNIAAECHSAEKLVVLPDFDDDGLLMEGNYYVQFPTSLYTRKYNLYIECKIDAIGTHPLLGDLPILQEQKNMVVLEGNNIRVVHAHEGEFLFWEGAFDTELYGTFFTIQVVSDGTSTELFVNGVSKGAKNSLNSKIRISTVGTGTRAGGWRVPSGSDFLQGVVKEVRLIDNAEDITPLALYNVVVNDTTKTLGFSIPTGYTLADCEYSLDYGATVEGDVPANPMTITGAKSVGEVGVRIKAVEGVRNESEWLFNNARFTYAAATDYPTAFQTMMALKGIPYDDEEVYFEGTNQQVTGKQYWIAAEGLWKVLKPFEVSNRLMAAYVSMGDDEQSNKVNFINPGTYDLFYPEGMTFTKFGQQGTVEQYADTGIVPAGDILAAPFNAPTQTDPSLVKLYMLAYTNSSKFAAYAYNSNAQSLQLIDAGEQVFADIYGGNNNARLIDYFVTDNNGAVGIIEANRTDLGNGTLARNGAILVQEIDSPPTDGSTFIPTETLKIGGTGKPWQIFIIGADSFTYEERRRIREAVESFTIELNRNEELPAQATPPTVIGADDELKVFTFRRATNHNIQDDYEYRIRPDGVTWGEWQPIGTSLAYSPYSEKYQSVTGSWIENIFRLTTQNIALGVGDLEVRVKSIDGVDASDSISNSTPFTVDEDWEGDAGITSYGNRFKPAHMTYNSTRKTVDIVHAFSKTRRYYMYEFTEDGGDTWAVCQAIPHYVGNKDIAIGQFGIRCIDRDLVGDQVISNTLWNTEAFTSSPVTSIDITSELRAFDTTVKGSITANSNVLTLSNNNYNLQVGDTIMVGCDTVPGAIDGVAQRGTRGLKTWPNKSYTNLSAALADAPTNASLLNNEWIWIEADGRVYRLDKLAGELNIITVDNPDYSHSIPKVLRASVTNVSGGGLTITLDDTPDISVTNASVYVDNTPVLYNIIQNADSYTEITATGTFPIFGKCTPENKVGLHLKFRGLTLFSPPCASSASFFPRSHNGLRINDYEGTDKFEVIGNYNFQGVGFDWDLWPTRNQSFNVDMNLQLPSIGLLGSNIMANDIRGVDGIAYCIWVNGENIECNGDEMAERTVMMPPVFNAGVPYAALYSWAIQVTNFVNVRFDFKGGVAFRAPYWINCFEFFLGTGGYAKDGIFINGHCANNGVGEVTMENIEMRMLPDSRYFQGSGTALFEFNSFFGDPEAWRPVVYIDCFANILDGATGYFPNGLINRSNQRPEIYNWHYHRPNMVNWSDGPGLAIQSLGPYIKVDGMLAEGAFGEDYTNNVGIGVFVGNSLGILNGDMTQVSIKNINAPIIAIPSGIADKENLVATERPVIYLPNVIMEPDKVVSGTTATVQATVLLDEGTFGYSYWQRQQSPGGYEPTRNTTVVGDVWTLELSDLIPGIYWWGLYATNQDARTGVGTMYLTVTP